MDMQLLSGKRVAVIAEHKFIPEEFDAYRYNFALLGMEVDFISRLWYGDYKPGHPSWKSPVFYGDVDPSDNDPWQGPNKIQLGDNMDVSQVRLEDYDAIIMSANYVSVRLRYTEMADASSAREFVQSAPVPRLFAQAMARKELVKGALCHGLWALTPFPELLSGRKVTCHTVVMADILNCNADIQFESDGSGAMAPSKVVVDDDLVTGFSKHEVVPFIRAIANQIAARAARN
ncbi:DJ-1/PfpI family protein [Aeromonas diversa]|uniref:DJ-1/PfpI family protein n=1 Tax=Aeromonas diversa TaxID=502790 RepID=UPI0034619C35